MTRMRQAPHTHYRLCDIEGQVGRDAIGHPAPLEVQITRDLKEERNTRSPGVMRAHRCIALAHLLIDNIRLNLAQRVPQLSGVKQSRASTDSYPSTYTADRIR